MPVDRVFKTSGMTRHKTLQYATSMFGRNNVLIDNT